MEQYIYKSFILASICLNLSCQFKGKEVVPLPKSDKIQQIQPDSIDVVTEKKHIVTCNCGDSSKLIVETSYLNVPDSITYRRMLIIEQKLHFIKKGGSKILATPFFSRTVNYNSKPLTIKETGLIEVKCISKGSRYSYKLYGIHWFDPPHEFFGLCSIEGDWLWYYYGSMHEAFKEYGNHEKYEEEFGSEIRSLKNMIDVLPKQNSNQNR